MGNTDKIFIEKKERVRLIIQHTIGLHNVLAKLREDFEVKIWEGKNGNEEIIILIEERSKNN